MYTWNNKGDSENKGLEVVLINHIHNKVKIITFELRNFFVTFVFSQEECNRRVRMRVAIPDPGIPNEKQP